MKTATIWPRLLCAILLWMMLPAQAADTGWLTTKWSVFCTDAAARNLEPDDCRDTASGSAGFVKRDLEAASQWLQSLGFHGPRISRDVHEGETRYIAWVFDESERPSTAYYDGHDLHVSPFYFFAMGQDGSEESLDKDMYRLGAPVHELFHAVQNGYANPVPFSAAHRWIGEGMAQAVLYAWLRRSKYSHVVTEERHWDIALSRPECTVTETEKRLGCYATQHFWTWLGQYLQSADDIQYLHQLLEQDLQPDRGITGVDRGLRTFDADGLYNLYPQFIAQFATEAVHYKQVPGLTLQYDPDRMVEKTVSGKAQEVAAAAHEIEISVPAGERAELKVELEDDHDDLHLIVGDRRADKNQGEARNVFRMPVDGANGPSIRLVRVANVARQAGDTEPRSYRLTVSLIPQNGAACTFEGTHSWSNPVSSGQEAIAGTAKIAGLPGDEALTLYSDPPYLLESLDLSGLVFGADAGSVQLPSDGHKQVRLQLSENSDPNDLQAVREGRLAPLEILDSGVSTIERMAMIRLRGQFVLETQKEGAFDRVEGVFDAGYGPYHCERGLEMQKEAFERTLEMMLNGKGPDDKMLRTFDVIRELLERD